MQEMNVESFSIGSVYYKNEDRIVVQEIEKYGITAVLADGMGGLSLGDVAAEVVAESVADYITNNYQGFNEIDILHGALEYADKELRKVSIAHRSDMGTAVAVAIVSGCHLYCTWQGNVRIYVFHDGENRLVSEDHIANIGYGRTALTRCIKGAGLRDDIPFKCLELEEGDKVYLCTDGLYNVADSILGKVSIDKLKSMLTNPEDDASVIEIKIR